VKQDLEQQRITNDTRDFLKDNFPQARMTVIVDGVIDATGDIIVTISSSQTSVDLSIDLESQTIGNNSTRPRSLAGKVAAMNRAGAESAAESLLRHWKSVAVVQP
jgi:hypothetical protein